MNHPPLPPAPEVRNLLTDLLSDDDREVTDVLAEGGDCRVERILSRGHVSPPDFWYDQEREEWVALVAGAARLRFEDGRVVTMGPGDHVLIPAHCRHRVDWTHPGQDTIWLAVHFTGG